MASEVRRRYFFVRHGRSEANQARLIASRTSLRDNDPALTNDGYTQALECAKVLETALGHDKPALIASPFLRTRQTADVVGSLLGIPVVVEPRLRERDFGVYEGTSDDNYRLVWERDAAGLSVSDMQVEPMGGVTSRILGLVRELDNQVARTPVVLFTHGDVISICWTFFADEDLRSHRAVGSTETADIKEISFAKTKLADYRVPGIMT